MMNNKLIIAAAGSGKTTYLINEAMKFKDEKVLITTYTEANEEEIKTYNESYPSMEQGFGGTFAQLEQYLEKIQK